jgi:hypothetical protein
MSAGPNHEMRPVSIRCRMAAGELGNSLSRVLTETLPVQAFYQQASNVNRINQADVWCGVTIRAPAHGIQPLWLTLVPVQITGSIVITVDLCP